MRSNHCTHCTTYCRLYGKLQTLGIGTALKILFADKEEEAGFVRDPLSTSPSASGSASTDPLASTLQRNEVMRLHSTALSTLLHSHCTLTVLSLYSHCTLPVFSLYSRCTLAVLSLNTHTVYTHTHTHTLTSLPLYSHCTPPAGDCSHQHPRRILGLCCGDFTI
jgi:hypothetical protein